jgi:hypothetical protein
MGLRATGLVLAAIFALLLVLFMIAPILVSAAVSFTAEDFLAFPPQGFSWRWYGQLATLRVWRAAVANTLVIGAGAALLATAAGTLAAYGISRLSSPAWRSLLVLLFIAPLAVPHMSLALALYPLFAQAGLIGTRSGLILGQAMFGLPFVVLSVLSVIRPRDRQLEAAARSLAAHAAAGRGRRCGAFLHGRVRRRDAADLSGRARGRHAAQGDAGCADDGQRPFCHGGLDPDGDRGAGAVRRGQFPRPRPRPGYSEVGTTSPRSIA